jgi:hypothetical protein
MDLDAPRRLNPSVQWCSARGSSFVSFLCARSLACLERCSCRPKGWPALCLHRRHCDCWSSEEVVAEFQAFESFLGKPDLRINNAKSFIYALDFPDHHAALPQQLRQFTSSPQGIIVLGTPIGSPAFEKNFCMETAAQTEQLVTQIQTLKSKQARHILCHDSANETIIHLARTIHPGNFFDAAAAHNTAIFAALQALTTIGELNEELQQPALMMQSSLPTSAGGSALSTLTNSRRSSSLLPTVKCSQSFRTRR